jgi:hypothetical protein
VFELERLHPAVGDVSPVLTLTVCIRKGGYKKALGEAGRLGHGGSNFVLHSHSYEEDDIHIESKKRTHLTRITPDKD